MLKSKKKKKRVFCTAPTRRKHNIRRPEGTPRQMCSRLHTVVRSQLQSDLHWPSSGQLVFKQSIRSSRQTGSILHEENKIFSDAHRLSMQIRASRAYRNQTHQGPDHAEMCALTRAEPDESGAGRVSRRVNPLQICPAFLVTLCASFLARIGTPSELELL